MSFGNWLIGSWRGRQEGPEAAFRGSSFQIGPNLGTDGRDNDVYEIRRKNRRNANRHSEVVTLCEGRHCTRFDPVPFELEYSPRRVHICPTPMHPSPPFAGSYPSLSVIVSTAFEKRLDGMNAHQPSGRSDRLAFRGPRDYVVHDVIGEGAYGIVCSATHKPSGHKVAIKRVMPFDHTLHCLRTLREIKLLRHFQHENIISILDVPQPLSYDSFREVYLVEEFMPIDLHRVIETQELSNEHNQYFIYQLLRGLKFIHSAGVLHRDLKPANLLLNDKCDLKICDFGLARAHPSSEDRQGSMAEHVVTRWYRAPEIMIKFNQYTSAIDLWSTGCILAEMLGRKVLFQGRDYHHQIFLILCVLGSPTAQDYLAIKSRRAKEYIRSLPMCEKIPWNTTLPNGTHDGLDLINRLLTFNPEHRLTAEEALKHPFVAGYHDPDDEPTSEVMGEEVLSFDRNDEPLSRQELKRR